MPNEVFPQVLLLGNGLNRAYSADSWNDLVKKLWSKDAELSANDALLSSVPFPLKIVLGTQDDVDSRLKKYHKYLCNGKDLGEEQKPLRTLLQTPFDHILTTNYSYELEMAANSIKCPLNKSSQLDDNDISCKKCPFAKNTGHTDAVNRVEPKFMLHSYHCVQLEEQERKIWHIHGEARKLDSVIIGHYYYGKLLWKMQNELEKREDKQLERQQNGEPVLIDSWVDAFIMGDVYILGFGFDLSEMDLWWLLNRKKRENANHGKTIFYDYEDKENAVRHALLRAYGAEVRTLGASKRPDDFKAFYNRAIEDIQMSVNNANTAEGLGGTKQ